MHAIFLDIETTGLDPNKHCAIDIGCKIIDISTGSLKGAYQSVIKPSQSDWDKRDLSSMLINGYTWDEVSLGKDSQEVAQEIIQLYQTLSIERGSSVFICQNPAFDRGFFTHLIDVYTQEKLNWPYHWLDFASMYWVVTFQQHRAQGLSFPEKMSLSKNDIARTYNLPIEVEPHRAINGVDHLIQCYQAVLGVKFQCSDSN